MWDLVDSLILVLDENMETVCWAVSIVVSSLLYG